VIAHGNSPKNFPRRKNIISTNSSCKKLDENPRVPIARKSPMGPRCYRGCTGGGGLAEVLSHFRSMITCGANHLSPAGTGIPRWFNSSRATSSGQNQPLPSVKCLPCGKILRRLGLQKASAAPHIYCKPAGQPPNPRKFPSPVWQMCPGSPRSLR
jgi:hypothetical protein